MILKYLEIQGFKSFPDKTKLEFGDGLTAVVGPNGSGKSNISDAVRWVLGEQSTKTLRGEKMEDVIFNGTQSRKSQGFAQVSLHIDNSDRGLLVDSDEVTVTRKYYRSGESEYIINGSNVRLKDINELFMDTGLGKYGYSMIGQGRIAEIVGAKSGERREIFEEASGISKFRYRKNESERRLKMAEENLVRLRDILSELEGRVEPLKIQSEKAKKYLDYAERKKILEISIWVHTLEQSTEKMRAHLDKLTLCRSDYDKNERQLEQLEAQTSEITEKMEQCLMKADELRREKEQAKSEAAERLSSKAVLENDIEHHSAEILRIDGEINAHSQGNSQIDEQIEQKRGQIALSQQKINKTDGEIEQKQQELLHLTRATDEQNSTAAKLRDELNHQTLRVTELKMSILSAQSSAQSLTERISRIEQENSARAQRLEQARAEKQEVDEGLELVNEKGNELSNSIEGYEMKLASRKKKLEEIQNSFDSIDLKIREKAQKAALLSDLEQSMEGFAYSVKSVIKSSKAGELRGVLGTVPQLISVEHRYSVAVETALGGAMQNIVVENESAAKAAIAHLKSQRAGRATFLPITSVKGGRLSESGLSGEDGYIALAAELVSADGKYAGIVNWLLGRTAVAQDIDSAAAIAKKYGYRFRVVTLDGQVVNAGGSFTGGSQNKNQGILSRRSEIEKLKTQAEELKVQKLEAEHSLGEIKSEVSLLEAQVVAINSEIITLSEDKIRFEGEKKRVDQLVSELGAAIDSANEEIGLSRKKLTESEHNKAESERLLAEAEQLVSQKRGELLALEGEQSSMDDKRAELSDAVSELKIRRMELAKDVENANASIEEFITRRESADNLQAELVKKKALLAEKINELKSGIAALELDAENLERRERKIADEITAVYEQRNAMEASTSESKNEQKTLTNSREGLARELARLEEQKLNMEKESETIINKLWEEYGLTRSEADLSAQKIEDPILAAKDLNEVKSKIKSLGSVNVDAIEEYKEVSERYEFLSAQVNDAESSRDELTSLIRDLTKQMQTIFSENFGLINDNFKRIFKELFGGGRAELALTDENDVLESGIEIFVQPPGKIINNLSSLSGGEQAFVAIAIYFAILKVRPAPFCILDEIEAALDEANVVKYARYLRQLSDKTQFIMITHRRGSMEEADVLYGVTMQEKGVSKLLKLNVSEIERLHEVKE